MSNKRIQKKRAKVAKHRARIDLVARLADYLCPSGTLYQKHRIALALWKRDDDYLVNTYWRESLRRSPFMRMVPRRIVDGELVNWRPVVSM